MLGGIHLRKSFWYTTTDQTEIHVTHWSNEQTPKAIIQIAHGMAEHILRYDDFANNLLSNGFHVYGSDHRGHGKTGESQGLLGYFSEADGFSKVVNDLYEVTKQIKQQYPAIPIILFGHSMGSFITRKYIQTYSNEIHSVILCGTGFFSKLTTVPAKILARTLPAKKESKLLNHLAFGNYNKRIDNPYNNFAWLSRDEAEVEKYTVDPFCGFIPTARFFYDLMDGLNHIHQPKNNLTIRKDLPMLIISGDADPVGNYGKGVFKVANFYEKIGIEQIKTMLIAGAMHEILNETNKLEVYQLITNWINTQIKPGNK